MSRNPYIQLLIIGDIRRDFIIDLSGKAHNNLVGGPLLYAAAGARLGNGNVGLVSRIGADFAPETLISFEKKGIDTNGIMRLAHNFDIRSFYHWADNNLCISENPIAAYSRYGLTFPHELLEYQSFDDSVIEKMWSNISIRTDTTFPHEYMDIAGVHLCPIDLATHIKMQTLLQKGTVTTITVSPSNDYMISENLLKIPAVVKDTTAFFPTEAQICSLFSGRTRDLWEMAEEIAKMGCPIVVILRGEKGYWLYDASKKARYILPGYPTTWRDPTGMQDVFTGAFLSEYKKSFDPVNALIAGNACASISVEGTGAFYCLESFPGLFEARQDVLRGLLINN